MNQKQPLFVPSEAFFFSVGKWAIAGALVGFGLAILFAVIL